MLLLLLFCYTTANAQECSGSMAVKDSVWVQNAKSRMNLLNGNLPDTSLLNKRVSTDSLKTGLSKKADTLKSTIRNFFKKDSTKEEKDPLIYFQQGYVQYNMNYRARIDTPYAENNIIQHLAMVNGQFILAGALPVNVSYIERQSNSSLFMDYRDVRADIDGPAMQRLQKEKLRQHLLRQVQRLDDSTVLPALNANQVKKTNFGNLLNNPKLVELLIQSKENIINLDEHSGSCKWKDSIEQYSKKFIDLYETKEAEIRKLQSKIDSLKLLYAAGRKKMQMLQKIINGHFNTGESIGDIREYLRQAGLDDSRLPKYPGIFYSLQRLSIGRTMPGYSPLTVQNVNVKGINAEFGNGIWYAAFTAGIVDYRIRDFITSKTKQSPQYVYAVKGGWGKKEGNHLFVTGYKGKKQIYSLTDPSSPIAGVSAELQYVLGRNHRFSAEVAQSSVPAPSAAAEKKSVFTLRDLTGRAYHLEWNSYFPWIKAEIGGFYQKTGINFQSFNGYRTNAAAESWALKYNQYFFGRQLRIDAGVRKNDFTNPLIAQNYSSNTVFKTVQATFKRRKWPTVSVGYIPCSQYAVIDSQVYESRYQTLTFNANHIYNLGTVKAFTNAFYSKFYNSSSDSGFVFYNADYFSVNQRFVFGYYTSVHGASLTRNNQFHLAVYQEGLETIFFRKLQVELGVKVNVLNNDLTKAGPYSRLRLMVPWLGDLSAWYEDSYLPGIGKMLVRNQQANIGFSRRIK